MQHLPALLLLLITFSLSAQDLTEEMRVVHCTAIDQTSSVQNIFVYDDKRVAVSTDKGIYIIFSPDNSTKINIQGKDHLALHNYPCGNKEVHLMARAVLDTVGLDPQKIHRVGGNDISCTFVEERSKKAWIGTVQQGLFCYDISDPYHPVFVENLHMANSKLKSNHINNILIDRYGRIWAGTKSGVLMGNAGKWKVYEAGSNIVAIDAIGRDVWIMAEDILYMVDEKNRWVDGDFVNALASGEVKDIEFDRDARLWIASESITRYNVEDDLSRTFDRSNGFTSRKVNCIKMDNNQGLWIGTADKGLFLIEKAKIMTVSCKVEKLLSCDGKANDAALMAIVEGGTPPYRYRWSNGSANKMIEKLKPGVYTVTISDHEGQKKEISGIIEDPRMKLKAESIRMASSSKASDGRAFVSVEGGTPDYNYLWDNGETNETARKLSPGKHTVTVKDKAGCESAVEVMVEHKADPKPEEVPVLVVKIDKVGENICPGEKKVNLSVKVEGGKAPFAYKWNTAGLKGENPKSIGAGKYIVTVSDASGQTAMQNIELPEPKAIVASVSQTSPATRAGARDGQARVKAAGGGGSYVYLWDNNESRSRAVRLTPGRHAVTISDANGCETTASISISTKKIPELDANNIVAGQTIRLENLYFMADSTKITRKSRPVLDEVFAFLEGNPNIKVEVGGHTNNIPPHAYCDKLSTARARSIADYIVAKGIVRDRIAFKGYGKRNPIASNETELGRKKNQRVEIKILSK